MGWSGGFEIEIKGVKFDVEFIMDGPSGTGDEMELDEVSIKIGDQEVSEVLSQKVIDEIDRKCFEQAPEGPEQDYEPEDLEEPR